MATETIGELLLEVGLDPSKMHAQFDSLEKEAVDRAKSIEKQMMDSIGGKTHKNLNLTPRVDLSELHELNKLLDVKKKHIQETQKYFDRNPLTIKVRVDQSGLKQVENILGGKFTSDRTITVKADPVTKQTSSKEDLNKTLLSLPKEIASEIKKSTKTGVLGTAGKAIKGTLDATVGATFQGLFQGLTQGISEPITKNLGKGLSSALENAISKNIGSTRLLGESIGDALSSAISSAIEDTLPEDMREILETEFKNIRDKFIPEKGRILEGLTTRGERVTREKGLTTTAREQANIERKESLRDVQDIRDAFNNISRRLAVNQQTLAKGEGVERGLRGRIAVAEAAKEKAVLAKNLAEISNNQEAVAKSTAEIIKNEVEIKKYNKVLEEATKHLEALSGQNVELLEQQESFRKTLKEAENIAKDSGKLVTDLRPEQSPKVIRQALEDITGRKVADENLPKIFVDDVQLRQKQAEAIFKVESNSLVLTTEMADAIETGILTAEQMKTLYHELQHAFDFDFGSVQGVESRRRNEILTTPVVPTAQELRDVAPLISQYNPEQRFYETNAEVAGRRLGQQAFERQQVALETEKLFNIAGYGGSGYEQAARDQLDKVVQTLEELNQLAEKSGIQATDGMIKLSDTVTMISDDVEFLLDRIAGSQGLKPAEIRQLQHALLLQFKSLKGLQQSLTEVKKDFVGQLKADINIKKARRYIGDDDDDPWGAPSLDRQAAQQAFRENLTKNISSLAESGKNKLQQGAQSIIDDPWGSMASAAQNAGEVIGGAIATTKKELDIWNIGIKAVAHDFEIMGNTVQNIILSKPAQALLGGVNSAAMALGQVAGTSYQLAQGIEAIALDLIPMGRTVKAIGQQTVVPAALFGAASAAVPGGEMVAGMMGDAMTHALGPLGEAAAGAINAGVADSLTALPGAFGIQEAIVGGISGAVEAASSGAVAAIAPIASAVLGGKALQTGAKALLPESFKEGVDKPLLKFSEETRIPFLPGSQKPRELEPVEIKQLQASTEQNIKQLAASPETQQTLNKAHKQLKSANDNLIKSSEAVTENAKTIDVSVRQANADDIVAATKALIADKFKDPYKKFKQAIKDGNDRLATTYAETIIETAEQAYLDIEQVTKNLKSSGENLGFGTSLSSKLGGTKGNIGRKRKEAQRYLDKQRLSAPDELEAERLDLNQPRNTRRSRLTPEQNEELDRLADLYKDAEDAADNFDAAFKRVDKTSKDAFEEGNQRLMDMADAIGDGSFLDKFGVKLGNTAGLVDNLFRTFASYLALSQIIPVLQNIASEAINASIQFEKLENSVGFAIGNMNNAKSTIESIVDSSNNLGVSIAASVDQFNRLASATKAGPLAGNATDALANSMQLAAAASTLTADEQQRSSAAISQIISKNKIYSEELLQLQEVGGVYAGSRGIVSRSLGIDPEQLAQTLRQGVAAEDFIPRFSIQLEAESFLAAQNAADNTQASINRLDNATLELQRTIGDGLIPIEKLRLDALTAGFKFLEENMDTIAKLATFLAFVAVKALSGVFIQLTNHALAAAGSHLTLSGAMTLVIANAKRLVVQAGALLAKFLLFQGAVDAIMLINRAFKNGAGDLQKYADAGVNGFNALKESIDAARDSTVELGAELPKIASQIKGASLLEDTFVGSILPKDLVRGYEDIMRRTVNVLSLGLVGGVSQAEKVANDVSIAVDSILESNARLQSEGLSQLGIEGTGAFELAEIKELDERLRKLNAQRRVLAPGDTEQRREFDKQLNDLREQREAPGRTVALIQTQLSKDLETLNAVIEDLERRRSEGTITADVYGRQFDQAQRQLDSTQQLIDQINAQIREAVDAITLLERAFASITLELRDANLEIERQNAIRSQQVAAAQLAGATPGQVQGLQSRAEQQQLVAQLTENRKALQQLNNTLASTEIQETLAIAGLSPTASAGAIESRASEIPEDTRERRILDLAAQYTLEAAQLEVDAENVYAQLLQSEAQVRQSLIDFGRQLDDFYRGIAQQSEDLISETQNLQINSAISRAKNDLEESMIGFSKSFLSGFTNSLVELLDALGEKINLDLQNNTEIRNALRGLEDVNRQATELNRQNPNSQFNAVGQGAGAFVGYVGGSGIGTGVHLDARVRGGQRRITDEELNRFQAGGRSITDYRQTSEFGSRIHPVTGERRHHGGRDFAIPEMTPITTTVPIKSVNLRDPSQTGGGGWVTDVMFEDGLEISLLHLDPSTQGTNLGASIGSPTANISAVAPTSPSGSNAADLIAGFEGFSPTAFWDHQQYSVGYGTRASSPNQTVSESEARQLLEMEVERFRSGVDKLISTNLNQNQLDALTSLAYNIGLDAFSNSTLLRELNAGNVERAADEILRWNKASGEVLPGLQSRRQQERQLFLSQGTTGVPTQNQPVNLSGANQNVQRQIQNLNIQLETNLAENAIRIRAAEQAVFDSLEESSLTMSDTIRQNERGIEDLRLDVIQDTPQLELERNLLQIDRSRADAQRELAQYLDRLRDTSGQATAQITDIENLINSGRIPAEFGARILEELTAQSMQALDALESAGATGDEIIQLYDQQRERAIREFERAEEARRFEARSRTVQGEAGLAGIEAERLRRGGAPIDAIRLESEVQRIQDALNFEAAITELEGLHLQGQITADELATLTRLERELQQAREQQSRVNEELALQEQRRFEREQIFNSQQSLGGAIADRRDQLGLGSGDLRRQLAISAEQQSLSARLFEIDNLNISADAMARLRDEAVQLSQINLDSINYSFSTWAQVLPGIQSSTQNLFSALITGSTSVSESLFNFFDGISQQLANLASQLITNQLFNWILGGVGGGGIGSVLGSATSGFGNIFSLGGSKNIKGFTNGGWIRSGNGVLDDVLIRAKKKEFVLNPEMAAMFAAQGLIPQYTSGGYVGGNSSPIMPKPGGYGGMMGGDVISNVNVNIAANGSVNTSTSVQGQEGQRLAQLIDSRVRNVIAQEKSNPRGLLRK